MVRIDNNRNKWIEIHSRNKAAPLFEPCTEENEKLLGDLEKHNFSLQDTQLGRLESQRLSELKGYLDRIPKDTNA